MTQGGRAQGEVTKGMERGLWGLLEHVADVILSIAPDGEIVQASPAAGHALGLGGAEIEGASYRDARFRYLRPDGSPLPPEETAIGRALSGWRPVTGVVSGIGGPDGTVTWFATSAVPLFESGGEMEGVVACLCDVSASVEEKRRLLIAETAIRANISAVATTDLDGRLTYVNPSFLKVWGYHSPGEVVGTSFAELCVEEERARGLIQSLSSGGGVRALELLGRRKDGTQFVVGLKASLIVDEGGKAVGITISLADITERLRAQQELVDSEEKYRGLVEDVDEGYLIIDGLTIVFANRRCDEYMGVPQGGLEGRSIIDFVAPEVREAVMEGYRTAMSGGGLRQQLELDITREDGSSFPAEIRMKDIEFKGRPAVALLIRDIIERRQAEEEIAHHTRRLRALLSIAQTVSQTLHLEELLDNALANIVEVMDADTGCIYLMDLDEKSLRLRAHRGLPPEIIAQMEMSQIDEEQLQKALEMRKQSVTVVPFSVKGQLYGLITVGSHSRRGFGPDDVDLLRAIGQQIGVGIEKARLFDEERRLRQELEEEMKRRVDFTRALVHELKTPLTVVLASSDLLVEELKEEPLLSLARNVNTGADNLSKRIDELLDLARGELGMLTLRPARMAPLPLLRGVADDVAPVAASHGQVLVVDLPPALPDIWGDEVHLRHVLLNLLDNAFKFTPEGGTITVRARAEGSFLIVEVEDTGPGIPQEEQARLFEPYHRVETDRERLSGLGLGLALGKTLVELHGGHIWVKSSIGEGSTFSFSIPLAGGAQQ